MNTRRAWTWRAIRLLIAAAVAITGWQVFGQERSGTDLWLAESLVGVGLLVWLASLILTEERPTLFSLGVWLYVLGGTSLYAEILENIRHWHPVSPLALLGAARLLLWVGVVGMAFGLLVQILSGCWHRWHPPTPCEEELEP